jgi:glycerol-3-phosphate dehydrogenase
MGMLDINTSDGRFLFFLPWQGAVLVGTTDAKGTPVSSPRPPEQEIQWILNEVKKYLSPELRVRRSDVLSAWYGWRPLASDPHTLPGGPVSRDHVISTHPATGTTFITGGKWTTYREMAEDVVDRVVALKGLDHARPCTSLDKVLWGGEDMANAGTDLPVRYTENLPIQLVQNYGVSERTAAHLAETYGVKAFAVCEMSEPTGKAFPSHGVPLAEGHPHIECEVKYACMEYTRTVADMLSLRTRLAYVNIAAAVAVPLDEGRAAILHCPVLSLSGYSLYTRTG